MIRTLSSCAALIAASALGAPTAHADGLLSAWVTTPGTHFIGFDGETLTIITQKPDGTCNRLGVTTYHRPGAFDTKLFDSVDVYLPNGRNLAGFISVNSTICNYNLRPIDDFNGNYIDIHGNAGVDWLAGGWENSIVWGGSGNDRLLASSYGIAEAHGDDGADVLLGGGHYVALYGENGNDALCADFNNPNASVYSMNGGADVDLSCGSAQVRTGVEAVACNACQ